MQEEFNLKDKFPPPKKVRVREKGQFTIPADIRNKMNIKKDDFLEVYQVGKAIIATPVDLVVKELARQVEREMQKNDYNLKDLLIELREGQHDYRQED